MPVDKDRDSFRFIIRQLELKDCDDVRLIWKTIVTALPKYINEVMLKYDPSGTFVAQDLCSGKLIGVCSGIVLSDDLGHMGQFIVLPEYRGMGVGSELWKTAMAHIGDRNVSLTSSPKMVDRYKRNGFPLEFEHWIMFFIGEVDHKMMIKDIDGLTVEHLSDANIDKVREYDRQICGGIDRKALIDGLLTYDDNVTVVAVNQKKEVVGYCVVSQTEYRHENSGQPLVRTDQNFADTPIIGELMLSKCMEVMASRRSTKLLFRCYECNKHFTALSERLGLECLMKEPLMFSKRVEQFEHCKINSPSLATFFPF